MRRSILRFLALIPYISYIWWMKYTITSSKTKVYYEVHGKGSTALLFAHGWLGKGEWWNSQREFFQDRYTIIQMDMPGHEQSELPSHELSAHDYADAIASVANDLPNEKIILVGHSMSGAYVLEASLKAPKVKSIVIVDTLKDLDQIFTFEMVDKMIFDLYRKDFKFAIENVMPQYLFSPNSPADIKRQLQDEFLTRSGETAIKLLAPLYKFDVREIAKQVTVPVRAINSDFSPVDIENNKKYLRDYKNEMISNCGHYPMLERPEEFNKILEKVLATL